MVALVALVTLGGLVLFVLGVRPRRRPERAAAFAQLLGQADLNRPVAYPGRTTPDDEANVPRWLRASVRAGRTWRPQPVTQRMAVNVYRQTATFDEPAADMLARMILRYDRVDLLDEPNEALARTLTVVGTGDEVDVLEVQDAWARVVTPRGATGWLPTMTLRSAIATEVADEPPAGEPPAGEPAATPAAAAAPAAAAPEPAPEPGPGPSKPRRARKRRAEPT